MSTPLGSGSLPDASLLNNWAGVGGFVLSLAIAIVGGIAHARQRSRERKAEKALQAEREADKEALKRQREEDQRLLAKFRQEDNERLERRLSTEERKLAALNEQVEEMRRARKATAPEDLSVQLELLKRPANGEPYLAARLFNRGERDVAIEAISLTNKHGTHRQDVAWAYIDDAQSGSGLPEGMAFSNPGQFVLKEKQRVTALFGFRDPGFEGQTLVRGMPLSKGSWVYDAPIFVEVKTTQQTAHSVATTLNASDVQYQWDVWKLREKGKADVERIKAWAEMKRVLLTTKPSSRPSLLDAQETPAPQDTQSRPDAPRDADAQHGSREAR